MKKFALTVAGAAVFFTGLGAMVETAGAKFKSDDRALELVKKARIAIGGDAAISGVQSMRIVGQTTRTIKFDGSERSEQGSTEIALQLPDKLMKTITIGDGKGDANGLQERRIESRVDVVVVGDAKEKIVLDGAPEARGENGGPVIQHRIMIRKPDGTAQELTGDEATAWVAAHPIPPAGAHTFVIKKNPDGTVEKSENGNVAMVRKADDATFTIRTRDGKAFDGGKQAVVMERGTGAIHSDSNQNELFKLSLSLLMTAPQGLDVSYTYGGEGSVDGDACDIVVASFAGQSYKLYLNRASSLPVMISYQGVRMPQMIFRSNNVPAEGAPRENMVFTRVLDSPKSAETVEYTVKFTNYRSIGGVTLPYRWTQSVGGGSDEVFDVTNYELNPANIAEKFNNQKVFVRTAMPATK